MYLDSPPSLVVGILPSLLCFACEGAEDVVGHAVSGEGMVGRSCCRGISSTGMPRSRSALARVFS